MERLQQREIIPAPSIHCRLPAYLEAVEPFLTIEYWNFLFSLLSAAKYLRTLVCFNRVPVPTLLFSAKLTADGGETSVKISYGSVFKLSNIKKKSYTSLREEWGNYPTTVSEADFADNIGCCYISAQPA